MPRAQKTALVVAASLLLALVTALAAQAASRGGGGGPTGALICSKLQTKLGARFSTAFASTSDCESQVAPVAQAALAACGVTAPPISSTEAACVRANVLASLKSMLAGGAGGAGGKVAAAAAKLATNVCTRLQANHPTAFGKRFSDVTACESTLSAMATTAIDGCVGVATPGTSDFRTCVKAALQAAWTKTPPAAATP